MHAATLLLCLAAAAPVPPPRPTPPPPPDPAVARELSFFPPLPTAEAARDFLSHRAEWLRLQRLYYEDPYYAPWFAAAIADNNCRYSAWDHLYLARAYADDPGTRGSGLARWYLDQLREEIGDGAYRAGAMPAVADLRFFRRAD